MRNFVLASMLSLSNCFACQNLELLISSEQIAQRIHEIAQQIDEEYAGEELTLISILKGSICVTADLMREMRTPCTLETVRASSYKNGTVRGQLKISGVEALELEGKNVLVIDDIFDSGYTMTGVVEQLKLRGPKTVKTLVLLLKNIPREIDYRPDYVLFTIEDRFVIGYGLDYNEYYRGLPGIYAVE